MTGCGDAREDRRREDQVTAAQWDGQLGGGGGSEREEVAGEGRTVAGRVGMALASNPATYSLD